MPSENEKVLAGGFYCDVVVQPPEVPFRQAK
jgi:hypothetical protein